MKNGFYEKLDTLAWNSSQHLKPAHNLVLQRVLMAGFSPSLAKRLVEKLPNDFSDEQALGWLREILARNLITESDEQHFLQSARVIALVGPTGVGKTTTIAKIAARYVMSHGAENLAFITTDSYRVGALEQLKVFGSILGVSVHAVKDQSELQLTLEHLKDRYTILIDTPGLCQRDPRVDAQMAMLAQVNIPIKRILCLNATNHIETSNDVVNVYARQSIDGCIITKVDEAITLGSVLNVVMQHKLKVFYLTNGQRVPEDIELVHKPELFERVIAQQESVTTLSELNETVFPAMFKHAAQQVDVRGATYA
jgi:flagellar biosynthesis protein FlhF